MRYRPCATSSPCCGIDCYGDQANVDGSTGTGWTATRLDGFLKSRRCIPTRTCALQPEPEAAARCGNSARRDPCGGPPARAVPTATPDARHALAKVHEQIAGLLANPVCGGMCGDAENTGLGGCGLPWSDKQDIETAQRDGVEGEEVGGQQPGSLGAQEGPPAGVCAAWCRAKSSGGQNPPDRASTHAVPEPGKFTLEPTVAPGGVFLCQAQHEIADLVTD